MQAQLQNSSMAAAVPTFGTIPPGILQRKCACGGSAGLTGECSECESRKFIGNGFQPKLRVSEAGDEYEREADRVSEQVMTEASHEGDSSPLDAAPIVQRHVDGSDTKNVQRQEERAPEQQENPATNHPQGWDNITGQGPSPTCASRASQSSSAASRRRTTTGRPHRFKRRARLPTSPGAER